jgi:hypothetical protein
MPFTDVSNTQQSGTILFHYTTCISLNVVFLLIDILGTNTGIVFDDEENCHLKEIKKGI